MKYLRNAGKSKRTNVEADSVDIPPTKKAKVFKQFPAISNEPCPIADGEDDSSFIRNNKVLIQEGKKLNPNTHTIMVLMERTFTYQRQEIMKTSKPIKDILKQYPSLKRLDQVHVCGTVADIL